MNILTFIFSASLTGFALASILLLIKPITQKYFGLKWQYYIWLIVLAAMIIPVKITLPQTAAPKTPSSTVISTVETNTANTAPAEEIKVPTAPSPAAAAEKKIFKPDTSPVRSRMLLFIWLTGTLLVFTVKLSGYFIFVGSAKKASRNFYCPNINQFTNKKITVRKSAAVSSPFIAGLIKPVLYLPEGDISEQNLTNILRHEITHLNRYDLQYKWFAFFVKCIHWFNPLIYAVSHEINESCEISCDAAATGGMTEEEENSYMNTILILISSSKQKNAALTSSMANSKKQIKRRFTMIKNKYIPGKTAAAISAAFAFVIFIFSILTGGVLASSVWENSGNVKINGTPHKMNIIHIDNAQYLYSDSYFVPLRQMFEALGCTVNYDIDRSLAPKDWQIDEHTKSFPQYFPWLENLVTNEATSYLYGATETDNSNMPVIEIISPGGEKWYCQVGSKKYTNAWAPPVIIMENTSYIPIRAVAYYVGGGNNVQWDDSTHDTYYKGVLTWDSSSNAITIDTDAKTDINYDSALFYLNSGERRIIQRKQNKNHIFCLVDNYTDNLHQTFIAIEKSSGNIAVMAEIDAELSHLIRIEFENGRDDVISLYKIIFGDNHNDSLELYASYNLTNLNYFSPQAASLAN